ncbi:hypothetical protein LTS08_006861 [Lithohypha guttulata]|uniref:Uncharacterized protein n=1 Tax=Lithohypha guttulata TaxID=1690604 RepID=A0AAN7T4N1_9EURO|nr:hypothetical protein LTR51_001914 [Lithohypha guttulata]KAK5090354.1 hypothetical protein LTR05_000526 [Lithohypha guttulata]KAK5097449.1 hypothetical protein LTS08_006861 [Lithohypha guttulata]
MAPGLVADLGHLEQIDPKQVDLSLAVQELSMALTDGMKSNTKIEHAAVQQVTPYLSTEPSSDHHWRIDLEGKVIAITGANRGIGLGIAEVCLANAAGHVYSLDLFEPDASEHAAFHELSTRNPGRLHFIKCDVTSCASINDSIATIVAAQKRFDGLVANAGMTKHQAALDFSQAQLEQLFDLNVFGAYHCATAAARTFKELGCKGSIVFTSSMTSYRPNRAAPSAPYGATKAAVRNLTHTLAMEWAQHGIRVNCVSPGFVRTQMTTYYVERDREEWERKMRYYGGMPRLADPRELGGAYVYLLSDGASYTSGIDIPIAGVVGAW